jgi:hypothetical protein
MRLRVLGGDGFGGDCSCACRQGSKSTAIPHCDSRRCFGLQLRCCSEFHTLKMTIKSCSQTTVIAAKPSQCAAILQSLNASSASVFDTKPLAYPIAKLYD